MRAVRQQGTAPEMVVRRALHGLGYRFRANAKGLPGSPDLAFTARRKAIFIHGCFWHRHCGCRLASMPKTRVAFWEEKFARNRERDRRKVAELEDDCWEVLTVWQCEVKDMVQTISSLQEFLGPPRVEGNSLAHGTRLPHQCTAGCPSDRSVKRLPHGEC